MVDKKEYYKEELNIVPLQIRERRGKDKIHEKKNYCIGNSSLAKFRKHGNAFRKAL